MIDDNIKTKVVARLAKLSERRTARLTPEEPEEIVVRFANGESFAHLSRCFGCSVSTIRYHVMKASK
jgi:DNA-binding CsgD family transcriptional regulator